MNLKHRIIPGLMALAILLSGCSGGKPPQVADATATPAPTAEVTAAPTATEPAETVPNATTVPADMLFDITVFPPTCQANGYSVYVSRETGGINVRDEVPRLQHDYSEWDIDMATGAMSRVCSMCGGEDKRRADGLARILLFGDAEALEGSGEADMEARFIHPGGSDGFAGWAKVSWQGYSDAARMKRDASVEFFDDEAMQAPHALTLLNGMALNRYPLSANVVDSSQQRHMICAGLWRQMGEASAVGDSLPVTVYVNGDFRGLYAMTLPPGALLYGMEPGQRQAAVTPNASWGAALLNSDDLDGDWRVLFNGETDDQWIRDELSALVGFLRDSADADLHEQLRAYLDTDTAIDYLLMMYALGLSQSATKDVALLKYDYDSWKIAPFDMSDAFNLNSEGGALGADVFLPVKREDGSWDSGTGSLLWDRLLNVFADDIARRWAALRQEVFTEENIDAQVSALMDDMPGTVYRADRALYRRRALITDPAAQMQGFVHERLYTLDEVFGNSETPVQ